MAAGLAAGFLVIIRWSWSSCLLEKAVSVLTLEQEVHLMRLGAMVVGGGVNGVGLMKSG